MSAELIFTNPPSAEQPGSQLNLDHLAHALIHWSISSHDHAVMTYVVLSGLVLLVKMAHSANSDGDTPM